MAVFAATARNILTLGLLGFALIGCAEKVNDSPGVRLVENARKSGQPIVVEFGANSCATCRNMKPILEATALQLQGRAHVVVIDLNQDYAAASQFDIRMMPTQVFFAADGKETSRHLGGMAQAEIVQRLGFSNGGN
jgi:thioredoxin 1